MTSDVWLYDTTLRDGAQRQGISFSLSDKLRITQLLADFGLDYVEGGWPGSNPKDAEYFRQVRELSLPNTRIAAFGSTRRVDRSASTDPQLLALLDAQTPVVTLVGKSSPLHVEYILRTTREDNLKVIYDSVKLMKDEGREVVLDAEHFFDGFAEDRNYAVACLQAASEAGADALVLCDTNGGSLPAQIGAVVTAVRAQLATPIGVHCHNDSELAVANSLAAVQAGARQVQGTINGIGERCGNANLVSILANLVLKTRFRCQAASQLAKLTALSRAVADIANLAPDAFAPFVGVNAFAHKGGLHVAAIEKLQASYEHIDPLHVGNGRRVIVSELAGRGNVRLRARELGLEVQGEEQRIAEQIKLAEARGLQLETADGSFELIVRRHQAGYQPPFTVRDLHVHTAQREGVSEPSLATAKVAVAAKEELTAAESTGPVAAIDAALRKALKPFYPELEGVRLTDYKVRILDPEAATGATTRVWIEAAYGEQRWCTVGCSDNIIAASAEALLDSLELFVLRLQCPRFAANRITDICTEDKRTETHCETDSRKGNQHGRSERTCENLA
ncbi:MAG TPA: citramalate synthase [Permianibacter sp.]|nr:citramalate synthase [Permianibacter sp.]